MSAGAAAAPAAPAVPVRRAARGEEAAGLPASIRTRAVAAAAAVGVAWVVILYVLEKFVL